MYFVDTLHNVATVLFRLKYYQRNERVQAVIPAERLLDYSIKQGWKPLCEFLGYNTLSTLFPRANVDNADSKKTFAGDAAEAKSTKAHTFMFEYCFLLLFL